MRAIQARPTVQLEGLSADPAHLRRAYGCFPSGVTAVCGLAGETPVGMAASSFTSVSLDPALVSVCIQNTSTTWPQLRDLPRLGLSVLAQSQGDACLSLSAKDQGDRFTGVDWHATAGGAVLVAGATVWLDCVLHDELAAGDHVIALLQIHGLRADPEAAPLVFHGSRFRQLAAV